MPEGAPKVLKGAQSCPKVSESILIVDKFLLYNTDKENVSSVSRKSPREAKVPGRKMSPGSPGKQKGWEANWLGGKKVGDAKVQFFQRRLKGLRGKKVRRLYGY